jgi:hypothetical protein
MTLGIFQIEGHSPKRRFKINAHRLHQGQGLLIGANQNVLAVVQ